MRYPGSNVKLYFKRTGLEFVPYDQLNDRPHIIVDGDPNEHTELTLSHLPKSGTPRSLKADTSAEIALNYITSGSNLARNVPVVSSNQFSPDGLVAALTLVNPERALQNRDLMINIASAGDFLRYRDPQALKTVFTITGFADPEVSPYYKELAGRSGDGQTAILYQMLIFGLLDIFTHIEDYRDLWEEEFDHVKRSEAAIQAHDVKLEEFPEIDLVVIESPEPLHPVATCSATDCLRVLTVHDGRYWLKYRYESWVQLVSRRPMPRIDLDPFVTRLQVMETAPGTWAFNGIDTAAPNLSFLGEDGSPSRSNIEKSVFIEDLKDYLQTNSDNPAVQWNPYDDEA